MQLARPLVLDFHTAYLQDFPQKTFKLQSISQSVIICACFIHTWAAEYRVLILAKSVVCIFMYLLHCNFTWALLWVLLFYFIAHACFLWQAACPWDVRSKRPLFSLKNEIRGHSSFKFATDTSWRRRIHAGKLLKSLNLKISTKLGAVFLECQLSPKPSTKSLHI